MSRSKKLKPKPHPSVADVDTWPYQVEGELEVLDSGDPDFEAEPVVASWAICYVKTDTGESCSFGIKAAVLRAGQLGYEEIETMPIVRASICPCEGKYIPEMRNGKFIYHQTYEAVKIELV